MSTVLPSFAEVGHAATGAMVVSAMAVVVAAVGRVVGISVIVVLVGLAVDGVVVRCTGGVVVRCGGGQRRHSGRHGNGRGRVRVSGSLTVVCHDY